MIGGRKVASKRALEGGVSAGLRKRILVVEDERDFGETLRRALARESYGVRIAHSGAEALEALEEERYDLVITDLVMPEMGGLQFIEELRRRGFRLPVIVITAYGDRRSYDQASRLMVSEFLNKPLSMAALIRAVRRALELGREDLG